MSEVVREGETGGATFATVVIMIGGGFAILEGHSLVARGLTTCPSGFCWSALRSFSITQLATTAIRSGGVEHPLARVNALDTSRWRTHGHAHR